MKRNLFDRLELKIKKVLMEQCLEVRGYNSRKSVSKLIRAHDTAELDFWVYHDMIVMAELCDVNRSFIYSKE